MFGQSAKCGVYKYAESEDFEILLFGYAVDGGAVKVIDLACGEKIPAEIIEALTDDRYKTAFNAAFRGCVCPGTYRYGVSLDLFHDNHPLSQECLLIRKLALHHDLVGNTGSAFLEGVGVVLDWKTEADRG